MNDFTFKLDIVKTLASIKTGDRIVVGYASSFDVDTDNTQITRQALEGAKDDLLSYSTVLFNHDVDRPIGKVIETDVDDVGLLVKVVISKEEDEIWKKIEEGIINKFSIKGRAFDLSPIEGENQILQINKIELFEVSLVSVPANKEAYTISHWVAKSLNLKKDVEETSNKIKTNMKDLLEKLKNILSKENVEEVKKDLDSVIKDFEKEGDIIEKLQVISGKLSGDDKEVVDSAIEILKTSRNKFNMKEPESEEEKEEFPETCNKYDLGDESEVRPVFQLNKSFDSIELSEDNKFKKQILKLGKWFHWDADGGVLNVTNEIIDNIVKNFKKSVIEHVFVPVTHTTDPTKNAGEVISLQKTAEGLDAVIEIKDETILEKIKKGLIKCVSASLDPNYRVKTSNKFVGPTLLHTALISEPYIKGMGNFVALSEGFEGRNIIQLEDEQPSFFSVMKALKDSLEKIENNVITSDVFAEEFAKLKTDIGIAKQIEEEAEKIVEEEKKEEKEEEKIEKIEKKEEEKEEEKTIDDDKESIENVEKKKKEIKVGDECIIDKKKGKYVKDGDELVCKTLSEEELKTLTKKSFRSCMSREMKAGKTMADASKICKEEVKKPVKKILSEAASGEKAEVKSENIDQQKLDFADAERVYEGYLAQGKIVPAQKDAFIKLMISGKALELGDNKVGVSELINAFMESQKTSINFEEDGVPVDDDEEKKKEGDESAELADVPEDAKSFFGKMGINKPEEVKKSWKNLQEMKKEEDDEKSSLIS